MNWGKWVKAIGSALVMIGGLGFIAPMLSAAGLLKLPGNIEWPVGSAHGVLVAKSGEYVVLVRAASRIQVYDPALRFLCGWQINPGEKGFRFRLGSETNIEVLATQSRQRFIYSLNGQLLTQDTYAPEQLPDSDKPRTSVIVPTRWWLWILTSPVHAWIVAAVGGGLLVACAWKAKPKPV